MAHLTYRHFPRFSLTLSLLIGWAASDMTVARAGESLPPSIDLDAGDLAQGPFATMHMLLQKTILRINVATIDVRVDKKAQGRFVALAQGKAYSASLEQDLAAVAIGTERAVVQMKFVRDVPLSRWMGVVRDNLEQARVAGLITKEIEQKVSQSLPVWFASLQQRGYEKGDRLVYAVGPDSVRTAVVSVGGQVLVDRLNRDPSARNVVMASYFAPKSDFREPLLRSLLGK